MNSLSCIGSLPNAHFLNTMQQGIKDGDDSVIGPILLYCEEVQNSGDVQEASALLFQVFPRLSKLQLEGLLKKQLPLLLRHASPQQQRTLSLQLALGFAARGNELFSSSLQAMHYFAKAIQIGNYCNDLGNAHQLASQLFMPIIQHLLIHENAFQKTLAPFQKVSQNDHSAFQIVETHITRITLLKRFCCEEGDHQVIYALYKEASNVLSGVDAGLKERYAFCSRQVLAGLNEPCSLPEKTSTERYWEALSTFRNCFQNIGNIREFQKSATEAFRELFKVFIEDALAILGPPPSIYSKMKYSPPCRFDIRAMGSLGREEVCPYSDLEFLILVEREDAIPYFKMLVQILEIQIASLGETSTGNPVFICIHTKNPSGLHIDSGGNPALHLDLIQTPSNMAKLQENPVDDPQTIENTVLKTTSIYHSDTGDPSLFAEYQKALKTPLEACREKRAYTLFATEAADYKKNWEKPFDPQADIVNIKEQYVKALNYLLSDLALFCGITETNTLDIIDALVAQKVFTPESGLLIKESVAAIYKIRIRLHLYYEEQREEASCLPHPSFAKLAPQEIFDLEKCYWFVLRPLYTRLQNVVDSLKQANFKEVFREVDLVEIAFQENLTLQSDPLINQIASHLCLVQAPLEVHVRYFTTLSKGPDFLRDSYLKIVEKNNSTVFQALLHIPNRAGLRPSFLKSFQKLKDKLHEITEPFSSQVMGGTEVLITAPHLQKARYLQPCYIEQIMDGENIRSMYDNSAHNVGFLRDLHFKQKPSHPLMEYAIHNLTSRIAGQLTPTTMLARFDVHTKGKKRSYPVILSQTIPGKNLKDVWQKVQPNPRLTWILLCSILTRPGDGRLSNYILDHEQNLHCVDNDLSFVEPVISSYLSRTVYFCSVPFCFFPLGTPLDQGVLKEFLSLDSYAIIKEWLEDLIQKEQEYIKLFTEEERKKLYEETPKNTFTPTILFREGTLTTLSHQFLRLQQAINLSLEKKQPMTMGDLLKELISLREKSIGAYVYKSYYSRLQSPEKKLQQATSRVQEKSMTSIQYHEACLGKIPSIKEIEQAELFSIEKARTEFLCTLFERNSSYVTMKNSAHGTVIEANFKDLNQDISRQALVLQALIEQAKSSSKNLRALILQHSDLLNSTLLSTLLEPLLSDGLGNYDTALEFHQEGLEMLDLRYCKKISNSAIRLIEEKCPNLKVLLLAGCTGLTEISGSSYGFSRLLKLPKLEHCDVSYCSELRVLKLDAPCLQKLEYKYSPLQPEVIELTNAPFWRTLPTEKGIPLEADYGKALEFHQKTLKIQIQVYGENHPNVATSCDNIGMVYNSFGNYDKALEFHIKTWQIRLEVLGNKHVDMATSYNNIGNDYNGLEDYNKALKSHEKALEIRREVHGDKHADVAASYNNIGVVYRNRGDYNTALKYFQKALDALPDKHPSAAAIHSNIGAIYDSLGNYGKALECHQKALEIRREVFGDKHADVATSYYNIGTVYRNLRNYDKALECHQKALKISREVLGDKHPDVAASYNNIALVYEELGNYDTALEFHHKALKILLEKLGDKHPDVATCYYNIGSVNDSLKNYDEALKFCETALEIRRKAFGENHLDVAKCQNLLGKIYYGLGKLDKALEFHYKALKIRFDMFGDKHPDVAASYYNISDVYHGLKNYDKALELCQTALEIRRKAFGENHLDVAKCHNLLGKVYYGLGKLDKALECHHKALKIKLDMLGDKHPDVAASYNNIGDVYYGLKNYDKAHELCQTALEIRRKAFGENHLDVAKCHNLLGKIYYSLGKLDQALECHKKALKIRHEVLGDKHPDVAASYNNIALVYEELGNYDTALEFHHKALKILLEKLGDKHPDVATCYYNIGSVNDSLKNYDEALKFCETALEIRRKAFGEKHLDVAKCQNLLGKIYYGLGKLDKALECHQKALKIRLDMLSDKHPDVAASYYDIGDVYHGLKNYDKALKFCQTALEIRLQAFGENHLDVAKCYNLLGKVYYGLGKPNKALECHQKASKIRLNVLGENHPDVATNEGDI